MGDGLMKNDGFFTKITGKWRGRVENFRQMTGKEKAITVKNLLLDNAMLIIILVSISAIAILRPRFISAASVLIYKGKS